MADILQWGTLKPAYYNGLLMRAHPRLHEEALNRLRHFAPSGAGVIDLGAGQGAFSMRLRDAGYTVTAVDKNIQDFKADDISFVDVDFDDAEQVENFCNRSREKYDIAIGMEVIEHVEDPWSYCRLLLSTVKPGGVVLITTPNPGSIFSRVEFLLTGLFLHFDMAGYYGAGHINPITFHEFELIAKGTGSEILMMESLCPHPWVIISRRISTTFKTILASLFRPFAGQRAQGDIICLILRKPVSSHGDSQ